MLTTIREFLQGKKTYLLALCTIITTAVAWAEGTIDTAHALELIGGALFASTIRAGIKNG